MKITLFIIYMDGIHIICSFRDCDDVSNHVPQSWTEIVKQISLICTHEKKSSNDSLFEFNIYVFSSLIIQTIQKKSIHYHLPVHFCMTFHFIPRYIITPLSLLWKNERIVRSPCCLCVPPLWLKAGTVEPEEMAVARQWFSKHVPRATNIHKQQRNCSTWCFLQGW
jgi:hypothetical protein